MSTPTADYSATARTGWILLGLTCGISLIPIFGFGAWLIAGPMLIAAFVLAIVVLSRGGTGHGILLLLCSVVVAPVFVFFAPLISTAIGVGGASATARRSLPAETQKHKTVMQEPQPEQAAAATATTEKRLAAERNMMDAIKKTELQVTATIRQVFPDGALADIEETTREAAKTSTQRGNKQNRSDEQLQNIFIAGLGISDGLVDGDHWKGSIWLAGSRQYTAVTGATKTVRRFALSPEAGYKLMMQTVNTPSQ